MEVGPGDSAQLTVVLESTAAISSNTIVAYLELPKGLSSIGSSPTAVTYRTLSGTSIPAGSVIELQFPLRVLQDTSTGTYRAKLVLEFTYQVYTYVRSYTEEYYIDIPVSGKPSLKVMLLNTSTYPGTQEISIKLVNDGSASAHDINLDVQTQPVIYTNITKVEVNSLEVGEEVVIPVKVNVPASLSGNVITLTTYLTYRGPLNNAYSDSIRYSINVNTYGKPLIQAYANGTEVLGGLTSVINVSIVNSGGVGVSNVTVRASAQPPLYICGDSMFTIPFIKPGEVSSVNLKLCSIPVNTYTTSGISIAVEYVDDYGASDSRSITLPIAVKPLRGVAVSLDILDKEVIGGEVAPVSLKVSNVGAVGVNNVTVKVSAPQNLVLLSPQVVRLGSMNPNDVNYLSIVIKAPYVESVTYVTLSTQLSYYDDVGNYYSDSYTFNIAVKPASTIPQLNISIEPRVVKALSSGVLTVRLANLADEVVSDVQVSLGVEGTPIILGNGSELRIESLGPRQEYIGSLPYVALNKPGIYVITANVRYVNALGVARSSTYTFSISILPATISLRVDLSPKVVTASEEGTLHVKIINQGDVEVRNMTVSLDVQSQLMMILNETKYLIPRLGPNEGVDLTLLIKPVYVSSYTITKVSIYLSYYDVVNQVYSETYSINVGVEPKTPVSRLQVSLSSNELTAGELSNVRLRVQNIGDDVAEGINLRISAGTALSVIGGSEYYISSLKPNEYVEVNVPIYVTPATGQYTSSLTISLTYLDRSTGASRSEDKVVTLLLRGKVDLRVVDYTVMPSSVAPGQIFSVTLTLINVGTSPAYMTFIYPLTGNLPIRSATEERAVYLSNIDVGASTAATITLQLLNTTQRSVRLPILITYLDNLRTPHNMTTEVLINVSPLGGVSTPRTGSVGAGTTSATPISSSLLLVAAVIAIVIAVIALRKFMRR